MRNRWDMIAHCTMWIATSFAIIVGLYVTRDSNCLFAFAIPAILQIVSRVTNF